MKLGISIGLLSMLLVNVGMPLVQAAEQPQARYLFLCKDGERITLSDTPTECYNSVKHINNITSSDFNKMLVVVQPEPGAACSKGSVKVDAQHRTSRLYYLEQRLTQLLENPAVAKQDNTAMSQVKYEKEVANFYKQREQLLAQFNTHKAQILMAECESKAAEHIHQIFDNQFMKAERLSNRDKVAKAKALLEIEQERDKVLYGELKGVSPSP